MAIPPCLQHLRTAVTIIDGIELLLNKRSDLNWEEYEAAYWQLRLAEQHMISFLNCHGEGSSEVLGVFGQYMDSIEKLLVKASAHRN